MRVRELAALVAALVMIWGVGPGRAAAAPIVKGDLLIYRTGDGSATLGTTATPVFLDEYTLSGQLVQSIPVTSSGTSALTAVGNATTEGVISRSQDGNSLVFTGYRKDAGGTNPSSDAPATTNRVIGTIGLSGVTSTAVALTDPTGTIRSATTVDGSTYYISASTGVRFVGTPSGTATSVQIDSRNSRQVNLADNTLLASNGSTSITGKVQSYGTLPTGATTATPLINLALGDAVNGFFVADIDPNVAGFDTIYLLSTVEGLLRKYGFDGTNWTAQGSVSTAAQNLTGVVNSGNVQLFLTTSNSLLSLTDSSGVGGTLNGSVVPLATAQTNTAFRGIGIVPEPTLIGGAMLTGLMLGRRRARGH